MFEESLITNMMAVSSALGVIIVTAMVLKRLRFPYTIGLVLAGMMAAFVGSWVSPEQVTFFKDTYFQPAVVIYVLLPTLIFEAALMIDGRLLMKNIFPILVLAIPGVLLSTLLIGTGLWALTSVELVPALIFGTLISATDPVAVVQIFKEIGVPKKLAVLVDGESLFNDAAAIVLFNLVVALFVGQAGTLSASFVLKGIWDFHFVFFGGIFVGYVVAFVVAKLMALATDDPLVQITAMILVAYVAFVIAEHYLHVSGVMATLTAGIVTNWYGSMVLSETVKHYIRQFWEFSAFLANSIIFLLLGITALDMGLFRGFSLGVIFLLCCAILLVVTARGIVVYGLLPLVTRLFRQKMVRQNYVHIVFWGGLRGALPLALAFSLDPNYLHRPTVIVLTLAVVLFTLILQGSTLSSLVRRLKLDKKTPLEELNETETRLALKQRGIDQLNVLEQTSCFDNTFLKSLTKDLSAQAEKLKATLASSKEVAEVAIENRKRLLWHHAIMKEREVYQRLFARGLVPHSVIREMELNIELTKDRIMQGEYPELFVIHVPLETKIKGWIAGLLIRFSRGKLTSKLVQQAYFTKYEISLAMAIASQAIEPIVKDLGALYHLDEGVVSECLQFYTRRRDLAVKFIQSMDEEDLPLSYRSEKIRLAMLNYELDGLGNMAEANTVYEKVLVELQEGLERELQETKKRLADTPVPQLL